MKKYYKTYRQHPTKRIKKQSNQIKAIFISLVLSASILDAIFGHTVQKVIDYTASQTEMIKEKITLIRLKTNYPANETIAYEASRAACKYHGLDTEQCYLDLVGMAYAEHRDFSNRAGDSGLSRGMFQINSYYHPEVTAEQANDPYWAAKWTLARMINGYNYPDNREVAIRSHNGNPYGQQTAKYIATVNSYINQ